MATMMGVVDPCSVKWEDGCYGVDPPEGFSAKSTLYDLCPNECPGLLTESNWSTFETSVYKIFLTANSLKSIFSKYQTSKNNYYQGSGNNGDGIDLCGYSCQEGMYIASLMGIPDPCSIKWEDGCYGVDPPEGFSAQSTLYDFCPNECPGFIIYLIWTNYFSLVKRTSLSTKFTLTLFVQRFLNFEH